MMAVEPRGKNENLPTRFAASAAPVHYIPCGDRGMIIGASGAYASTFGSCCMAPNMFPSGSVA